MKVYLFLIAGLLLSASFISCKDNAATSEVPELVTADDIAATDSLFSEMSNKEGMKAAFLYYMEDEAVIIRPNSNPLVGADAVLFLSALNDTNFKMTWKADRTALSTSNDLGYAYGSYSISTTAIDSTLKGSYVHVWKKLEDGSWKFVLNSWNEAAPE